jgi:hypothetical protein
VLGPCPCRGRAHVTAQKAGCSLPSDPTAPAFEDLKTLLQRAGRPQRTVQHQPRHQIRVAGSALQSHAPATGRADKDWGSDLQGLAQPCDVIRPALPRPGIRLSVVGTA